MAIRLAAKLTVLTLAVLVVLWALSFHGCA